MAATQSKVRSQQHSVGLNPGLQSLGSGSLSHHLPSRCLLVAGHIDGRNAHLAGKGPAAASMDSIRSLLAKEPGQQEEPHRKDQVGRSPANELRDHHYWIRVARGL